MLSSWEVVILNIKRAISSSSYEEGMVEDWISIYGFLEDKASKKGKALTLFEDVASIQEKSGRIGPTLFKDLGLDIQDKNTPKRT